MALVLALDGRGFAEFGTKGLRAVEVTRTTNKQQAMFNQEMEEELEKTNAAVESAFEALSNQEEQLERLEEERLT